MSSLKLISATDALYSGSLLKSINEQRNVGLFCDVTIIINDRKFRAHRNILSGSSSYFHQVFCAAGQVIELDFVRAEIFDVILNYIYSSKIVRIPSDLLEELITAGQALGVKFFANLHVPLSQVKGLPGLSKESGEERVKCKDALQNNDVISQVPGSGCTSIITEAFSLYAEEFDQGNDLDKGDVLFISKQASQNKRDPGNTPQISRSCEVIDEDGSSGAVASNEKKIKSSEPSEGVIKEKDDSNACSSKKVEGNNQPLHSRSSDAQLDSSSLPTPAESPVANASMHQSPAHSSLCNTPATPAQLNLSPTKSPSSSLPKENQQMLAVQKKEMAVLEKATTQSVDFKNNQSDVGSVSSSNNGASLGSPQSLTGLKKTITLDKASEIDSLSTGCKVYANIGENTYDIVPVKEDPGEGDSKASRARKAQVPPSFSPDASPHSPRGASSKKKAKVEQDDHYELIMDGKTFYVCIICKRPYVCLTSLRRHFNTHSWEKKYPCHYCDKVFALAEYRTKHEVYHTGERRYQCLLCNEFFINYQLLSSHCKQVHNQDPSGRKEKDDTNNNLYRLLPCKTLQFKPYSYVTDGSGGIPIIKEDGMVYHVDPSKGPMAGQGPHPSSQGKPVNWDDLFVEPGVRGQPVAHGPQGPCAQPVAHGSTGTRGQPVGHSQPVPHGPLGAHAQPLAQGSPVAHGAPGAHGSPVAHGPPRVLSSPVAHGPPGVHGSPVAHGPPGVHGSPVAHGPPGVLGSPVAHGPPGVHGSPIAHGPPGAHGSPVAHGPPGAHGSPVVHGPPGSHGSPVAHGPPGAHSSPVAHGPPGVHGSPVAHGPPGVHGSPVAHGPPGAHGSPVAHGPPGVHGSPVAHGPPGVHGSPVAHGPPGAHGSPVAHGPSGAHGSPVAHGPPGAHGSPVAHGPPGAHGSPVAHGPPIMHGPPGAHGSPVAHGPPITHGSQGARGSPGAHGPPVAHCPPIVQGSPGAHGPPRAHGSPVSRSLPGVHSQPEALTQHPENSVNPAKGSSKFEFGVRETY
ncbi:transcriptional regulator Kaiso-like isoform X2 [Anguilla anguilla]|uniref:transcriptional regulator Kaiso-like isoform X2 n=1 Tax=Anguilla anguilla TaxID=7936 RepID=UPI0015B16485|nr:transcriptional regulator Kaiso-like isoform X2 [Anguilla anguilla]